MTTQHDSPGIREVTLVMGLTGWGKSWWTKLYKRSFSRSLTYDPSASFPCGKDGKDYDTIDNIVADLMDEPEKTVFNPEKPKKTLLDFDKGFMDGDELQAAGGLSFALGKNVLIVEECATVFEKGLARIPEWCKRVVFYGRHRECSIVLIAQRPTYIPIDFRSQANRVITFCQHEGADMNWLLDFFGKERMERLSSLPKFHCFDYHNGQVSEYSIVKSVKEEFGVSLDNRVGSQLPSFV